MEESKHERAATEFEGDAGVVTGGTLNQASMARRSFLNGIARWSAALAVVGLGPEALMQAVFRRGVMSSAVASGSARNRQFHPFPADDPFNMPLGVNAWYAPITDPATSQVAIIVGHININNGASQPIFFPTTEDPIHEIRHARADRGQSFLSYRPEEHLQTTIYQHLQTDAVPSIHSWGGAPYSDRHLHVMMDNDVLELFEFKRDGGDFSGQTTIACRHGVRNRTNRYCFGREASNSLKNVGGTRAWGGSAVAGLIRKHEVETATPHIPHAVVIANDDERQVANAGKGNPSSPLYNISWMFPATKTDAHGFEERAHRKESIGDGRMGMRLALDPSIATDAWIQANAPKLQVDTRGHPAGSVNPWQVALAKALRDYGGIVCDTGPGRNIAEAEAGIATDIEHAMNYRNISGTEYIRNWRWMWPAMRRVAGRLPSGTVVHNPLESHWDTWRANGEGWGGGAPRVPYSGPLSGDLPPASPDAPSAIEVSAARILDGTG